MVLRIFENPIKVINLYGIVKSERDKSENETIISTKFLKTELENISTDEDIIINLNSPGGDVFEGITIFNMLNRHKGKVTIYVVEEACSIASVIAMAGDVIKMPSNSKMMIHEPSTFAYGGSKELLEVAERLDKVRSRLINCYLSKNNTITEKQLSKMIKEETWMTGEEAKKLGFCDEVLTQSSMSSRHGLNNIKNKRMYL